MLSRKLPLPAVSFYFVSALIFAMVDGSAADKKPAATSAPARSAVPALTAVQIVEKHVAARGGLKAWRSVQVLALSGKMDAGAGDSVAKSIKVARGGMAYARKQAAMATAGAAPVEAGKQVELPFVLDMKRPNLSRLEIQFAGKTAVQVYDGRSGWKLRPFLGRSDVEAFTAEETRSQEGEGPLDGPLIDYAAKGTKLAFEKIEPVEGRDTYKLKLTMKDGRVQHVWIDAQTFLDVKTDGVPRRMDGRLHDVWIYQRDFRSVQGVTIPFVVETAVDGYPGTHKLIVEKAEVNPKLDDAAFAKPRA